MTTKTALLFCLTLLNFSIFYWGILKVFKERGSVALKDLNILKVATLVTWMTCGYCLIRFPVVGGVKFYLAVALQLGATSLFIAAKKAASKAQLSLVFSDDKPMELLNHGPYKWLRHPFYTSYIMCYLGSAIGSTSWTPYLCTLIMIVIYVRASKMEEAKFEHSELAASYREYRAKTGAFFPIFPK